MRNEFKIKWFFKGIRIEKWHRNIFIQTILFTIIMPTLSVFVIKFWNAGLKVERSMIVESIFIGLVMSALLAALMYKAWFYLFDMQKLCRMAFDSVLYNLEGEEVDGKITSSRKDMTYFPKIYYYRKKGILKISVMLDGSKYHSMLNDLTDTLRDIFNLEVISATKKYWYRIYTLSHVEDDRLKLGRDKIEYNKTEVPLMGSLSWDFKKVPHALITGSTGGGKSYFMFYFIRSILKLGADVKIIDPKRSDLFRFRSFLGDENVVHSAGGALPMCRKLVTEMERRYELLDKVPFGSDYDDIGLEPTFLIFDEFVGFLEVLKKVEEKKEVMAYLLDVVLKGRQAGIFVVFATQRADAAYMTGIIRDNLGLRISLGVLSASGYRMTFGDIERKLEKFEQNNGHGYIFINGVTDNIREFYSPFLGGDYDPMQDIREILEERKRA